MYKQIGLILACVTFTCQGGRLHSSRARLTKRRVVNPDLKWQSSAGEKHLRKQAEEEFDTPNAFAKLLLAFDPASAFNHPCLTAISGRDAPDTMSRPCKRVPVMKIKFAKDAPKIKFGDEPAVDDDQADASSSETSEEDKQPSTAEVLQEMGFEEDMSKFLEQTDEMFHIGNYTEAEARYRSALSTVGPSAVIGGRLAAVLGATGRRQEAADTLHGILQDDTIGDEERCWMLVDLGSMLEELAPLPGTGPEWAKEPWHQKKVKAPTVQVGHGDTAEQLSAVECYRRAHRVKSEVGEVCKRLADMQVALRGAKKAYPYFKQASDLLPEDICCRTHAFYDTFPDAGRADLRAIPLPEQDASATIPSRGRSGLAALQVSPPPSEEAEEIATWTASAASAFEQHGVIVLPRMLEKSELKALRKAAALALTGDFDADLTMQTRAHERRIHKALPLTGKTKKALSKIAKRLQPLLGAILQANHGEELPLLGCGCMQTFLGANAQELHKDVHGSDRHGPVDGFPDGGGGPRAVSVQIQLTDTAAGPGVKDGSLEVLPGSHRYDAANGREEDIRNAISESLSVTPVPEAEQRVVPITVPAGTVTLYSSRLWHQGGPNHSDKSRTFCFLTVGEPQSPAPPGLIHTMNVEDIGSWVVASQGSGLLHKKQGGGFVMDL